MSTKPKAVRRGELWLVSLDPTRGSEMRKTRPAVVLSSDAAGVLPIKLIAPITEWHDAFQRRDWMIRIDPTPQNGLSKASAVDVLQLRGLDLVRFATRLGELPLAQIDQIATAVANLVEAP